MLLYRAAKIWCVVNYVYFSSLKEVRESFEGEAGERYREDRLTDGSSRVITAVCVGGGQVVISLCRLRTALRGVMKRMAP